MDVERLLAYLSLQLNARGIELRVAPEAIHLKAKTNEGVDAIGRGEAIAAHVVATLSLSAPLSFPCNPVR